MNGTQSENRFDNFGLSPLPPKGGLGIVAKILIVLALAAVAGSGTLLTLLGTRAWDPLWNPFRPEPEKVIAEMASKSQKIKSLHSNLSFEFEVKDEKNPLMFTAKLDSNINSINVDEPKGDMRFIAEVSTKGEGVSLDVEAKQIGVRNTYFKLGGLNFKEFEFMLMLLGFDRQTVMGKWIKFDNESLKKLGITGEEIPKEQEKENIIEKLAGLFNEKKFFFVKKELKDEKIGGEKMYHYLLLLEKDVLEELINGQIKKSLEATGEATRLSQGVEEGVKEFLNKIGDIDIELWIGKRDNLLYMARLEKTVDAGVFTSKAKGKGSFNIKLEANFSDFNQPIEIEAPKDFVKLEDVLSPLLIKNLRLIYQRSVEMTPKENNYKEIPLPYHPEIYNSLQASLWQVFSDFFKITR